MDWKKRYTKIEKAEDLVVGKTYSLKTELTKLLPDYEVTVIEKYGLILRLSFIGINGTDYSTSANHSLKDLNEYINRPLWEFKLR